MTNSGRLSQSFEVKFNVEICVEFDGPDLVFTFHYNPPLFQEETIGVRIPLEAFRDKQGKIDPERLSHFHTWLMTAFHNTRTAALERDFQLHFLDTLQLLLSSTGIDNLTIDAAIVRQADTHRDVVANSLRKMMQIGLKSEIKSSRHWTPVTLTLALLEVKTSLGPGGVFNYVNAHRIIKDRHPETAPASPEALKKLVMRLGVDWKAIKAHSRHLPVQPAGLAEKGH